MTTPRRRWTDTVIEHELRGQCAELGHFPSRSELVSRGLRGLWDAMRSTGGADAWRERLEGQRPVSHAEIAALAYHLYEGGSPGGDLDHWLAAERRLAA